MAIVGLLRLVGRDPSKTGVSFTVVEKVAGNGPTEGLGFTQVPTVSSGVDRNEVSIAFEIVLE